MNKAKPSQRRRSSMVPKAVQGEIQRERLLTQIADTRDAKLVMLMAPAGYGKTTLLAQACRASKRGIAWLTLSEDEASASRLALSLAAAISKSLPEVQLEVFALAVSNGGAAEGLATALAADLNAVSINLDLVLDRAEHLGADATRWLERLLRELAEGHRVLLAGYDTTLPLAQWVAAGKAVLIETSELAFTAEETGAYLAVRGSAASSSDAHDSLEGWPAGVALIAAGATPRLQPRDLILEVLQYLTADLRAVIADAAVLEVWNEAAARKLGCELPAGWLKITQRAGLPMTPMGRGSLRPHTVLLEVLETELLARPQRHTILHQAAGANAEQTGDALRALHHFKISGDTSRSLILAERLVSEAIDRWEYRLARGILKSLGEVQISLSLRVKFAWTLMETGDAARAESMLLQMHADGLEQQQPFILVLLGILEYRRGRADKQLLLFEKIPRGSLDDNMQVRALLMKSAAMYQLGRVEEDLAASTEAAEIAERIGNIGLLERALDSLATSYAVASRRVESERAFQKALHLSERLGLSQRVLSTLNNFANFLSDWGRVGEALSLAERGVKIARVEQGIWLPLLLCIRGLQHFRLGDFALAQHDLQEALPLCQSAGMDDLMFSAHLWLSQSFCLQHLPREASDALAQARRELPSELPIFQGRLAFGEGFHALVSGDLAAARDHFEACSSHALDSWDEPRALALRAEVARRQGSLNRAMIVELIECLDALGHDQSLASDQDLLSGLFTECVRRRWFVDRLKTVTSFQTEITTSPKLEITSLGAFEARVQNKCVHIPLVKSMELLTWLSINGCATRDEIVRALWGKSFEHKDVEYFKVAVRKLRTALSECPAITFNPLPFEHGVYQLSERFEIIVDAATLLCSSDSLDAWTLLETHQGVFLPGVNSDWVEEMRQQMLEALVTKALQLGSSLELQDPQDAIQLYKRLMTVDPICEGAYLGLERTFRQIGMEAEADIAVSKWRMQLDDSSMTPMNRSRATAPRAS